MQEPSRKETSSQPPIPSTDAVSRQDVMMAFKLILGRDPESDNVVRDHQLGSLDELRLVLLKSEEFREKYKNIAKAPI